MERILFLHTAMDFPPFAFANLAFHLCLENGVA